MEDAFDETEIDLLEGVRDDALEDAAALIEKIPGEHFVRAAQLIRALKHESNTPDEESEEGSV